MTHAHRAASLADVTAVVRRWIDEQTTTPVESAWTPDPLTGALIADVPLTWWGVREYVRDGGKVRILRRPEVGNSRAHLDLLAMVTPTHGHPRDASGKPLWVTPSNFARLNVGHIGDNIRLGTVAGYEVPIARARVFDQACCYDIEVNGKIGASLGYACVEVGPHPRELERDGGDPVGVWDGPEGPLAYDIEHIMCPAYLADREDPRVAKLFTDGLIVEDEIKLFGPNHEALGIAEGRGAEITEVRPTTDEAPPPAAAARRSVYFRRRPERGTMKTKTITIDSVGDSPAEVRTINTDMPEEIIAALDAAMMALKRAREMLDKSEGEKAVAEQSAQENMERAETAEKERDEIKTTLATLKGERDSLLDEVKPLREAKLRGARDAARPHLGGVVDAMQSHVEIDKALAVKLDPSLANASDAEIAGYLRGRRATETDSMPRASTRAYVNASPPQPTQAQLGRHPIIDSVQAANPKVN